MPVADKIKVDLTNVESSMTNIIHNNADRLYSAQSVRELHSILSGIFEENDLDTEASRSLLLRVLQKRNLEQALSAVFNSYLYGAGMGRNKEKIGGRKTEMFKIDEKLKKIVSEEIEKIEVTTDDSEITVETEGEAVKVEIEPKTAECVDCKISDESSADLADYEFFSDLNPETDIDDVPADFEDDTVEPAEEGLFKESARGEASEALWDFVETADRDTLVMLCQGFVKWLSEDDCKDFARIYEIGYNLTEAEEMLSEGVNKKYLNALKDKVSACYTKQDLEDIGAFIDDLSDKDIDRILSGKVSNKDLNKMFGGYNFVDDDFPGWDFKESKSIKEGMNWTNGEEEYEIDSTLASAPINSIIFIKKSYGGKNRILKFEKVSTDKWDSLNKFNDRTGSYESDKSLKDKYIDGATWKLEKAVNESKSIKESYSYSRIYEYIDSILGDCCRGERRWPKADPNDFARILEDEYNLESEEDYSWKDLCRVIHDIYPNGEYAGNESLTESTEDKLTESIDIEQYRTPEWERYETVRAYTVYLPTPKGKQEVCIGIEEYDDGQYQAFCNDEGSEFDHNKFNNYLMKNHYYNWNVLRDDADDCLEDVETLIDDFVSMDEDDISKLLK